MCRILTCIRFCHKYLHYKIFGFLASQGVFYLVHVSTYRGVFFGIPLRLLDTIDYE